jgi:branched-chain amino acid transport system substrate-binding protein
LTVVVADDAGSPSGAVVAANALLNAGVVAVVGHSRSGSSLAAQPIYNAAGVPMVSPASSHLSVTAPGYTTTFRTISRDDAPPILLATYLYQHENRTSAAIVELGETWEDFAVDAFENTFTASGGTITSRRIITWSADYTATIAAIQAEGAQLIFYADFDTNQAARLSRTAHNLGMSLIPIVWNTFDNSDATLSAYAAQAGLAAEGDYAGNLFLRPVDMPGYPLLDAAYQSAAFPNFGDQADWAGAFAYDAANIIFNAMSRAHSGAPGAIREAISNTANYRGVVGTYVGFDAKGDVIPQWAWIAQYRGGQWVTLYPPKTFLPVVLK